MTPLLLSGGRLARGVTRLSHRRKKKKSFLKILKQKSQRDKRRVDSSTTDLMEDTGKGPSI